ncbi:MAG TPA: OmpH family outer membrane protein [bacterium]|nr:OmpH family outer membrane protein [bacterium]
MKKMMLILAVAVLTAALGSTVSAQELKIAFIHTQKVILETKAGKEGYSKLEQIVEEYRQQMQAQEDTIKALEEELAKQGKMLSDEARLEKREELQRAYKEYSRLKEDAKAEVANREKALLDKIIDQLADVINRVAKEQGYTMILDAEGPSVLYADDSKDISSLIVQEFDKVAQ